MAGVVRLASLAFVVNYEPASEGETGAAHFVNRPGSQIRMGVLHQSRRCFWRSDPLGIDHHQEEKTNQVYSLITNEAGEYSQPYLPVGSCDAYISGNGVNPATLLSPNPYQTDPNNLIKYNGSLGTRNMTNRDLAMPYPFFTGNLYGGPVGFSTYNALMAQFTKNHSNGLTLTPHYTWSKSMNLEGSEIQNNNYVENGGLATGSMDLRNNKNSYFLSTNDIPHRLVGMWSWAPPVGKGKRLDLNNRLLNALAGNWNIGGVVSRRAGSRSRDLRE